MTSNSNDISGQIQSYLDRADWRQRLVSDYDSTANRLLQSYQRLIPRMQQAADDFNQRLNDFSAANEGATPTPSEVRSWRQFQSLLNNVEAEMNGFSAIMDNEAATIATSATQTGVEAASDLYNAAGGLQVVTSAFNRPDPLAIQQAANYVDSDAFRANVAAFGANASDNLGDVIIAGIAAGKNPTAIASVITNWLLVPYTWAENTVRTTQLWSYRTASHETYRANSNVVQGWMWWASLDARCCLSCVAQHGRQFSLDETLNDHHRGRCTPLPVVIGSTWSTGIQSGRDWFTDQDAATQREMMGAGRFEMYQSGMWDWNRVSRLYENDVFGTMRRQATMGEMQGG